MSTAPDVSASKCACILGMPSSSSHQDMTKLLDGQNPMQPLRRVELVRKENMTTLRPSAKRLVLSLSLVLLCTSLLRAEEPQAAPAPQAPQAAPAPQVAQGPTETRTGCLTVGSRPGTYTLIVDMSGEQLSTTGQALEAVKVDQKVVVTGNLTRTGNIDEFHATKVELMNIPCQTGFSADALKKSIGHARFGFRGGIALDPETINIGVQAEFGPLFRNIYFRPTSEFAFGEVTKVFSVNPEFSYYLPFTGYGHGETRWNSYIGAGPAFTIARRDFQGFPDQPTESISDWDTDAGLNIFVGLAQSNGLFFELKATAYTIPAVRLNIGYSFK
jgi:hypothetical protein